MEAVYKKEKTKSLEGGKVDMKKKMLAWLLALAMVFTSMPMTAEATGIDETTVENTDDGIETVADGNVAKVGNTEYATIDEAIANWTNGTTLTLLANVTLSDVIQLSSTEHHILDLSTYTMTAASKKDAIQIVNNGRSSASYTLDIKADATNPGGITATGKAVVKTTGKSGVKDRPIIRFYNGVFTGTNVVHHSGSNGTNSPQFQFHDGEFNGTVYTNRSINQFYGGTFTGSLQMSVDSSSYTLIAGGTFAKLSNMAGSALNSGKFTIGSAKGVYDKEVYIDDNGNYVIAATEPAEGIEASVAKTPGTNDYLAYSKVATEGALNYTDASLAIANNKSATVTVYTDELDMAGIADFKGTIVAPEGQTLKITNAPEELKTEGNVIIVKPVAKVNGTGYYSLQEAIDAAKDGETITLLNDLETSDTFEIENNKKVTLDLNGKTITATDDKASGNYELFYNYGELTVKGNGAIELTAITDRSWNASSSIFHNRGGLLTIENGTFTHNGGTAMAYVVDNNANSYGDATTTIKDGSLSSKYIGIRNRMDTYGANGGGNGIATLNISGGNINGKYAVWGQVSSAGVKGAINISGGKLTGAEGKAAVLVDSDTTGEVTTVVSGGTFSSAIPEEYCAEGYIPKANDDGTYGVKKGAYIAQVGDTKYDSLQDAFEAAKEEGTVKLINSFALNESVSVNGKVTLDLNGKTITGTDNATGSFGLINVQPGAELTVEDSVGEGAITLFANNNRGWNAYSSVISNQRGTVVVNAGTIEHRGGTDMAYGIDNLTNGTGTEAYTTINGGKVKSPYRAIRQFLNGTEAKNVLVVNGGTIEGTNKAIWVQGANNKANSGAITVKEDAKIYGNVYLDTAKDTVEWPLEVSIAKDALKRGSQVITENLPAGYVLELNADYSYELNLAQAIIGDVSYETVQEAIDAAKDGDTVKLLVNVEIENTLKIVADKKVTIDLNGKIIDGTEKVKIALMSYGDLSLMDSSAAQTGMVKAGIGTAGNAVNICAGTFTMDSGSIYSKNNAILVDEEAAVININGGAITAEPATNNSAVFYISSTSDTVVNITAGELVGFNGILLWNNTVINMSGGSIDAQGRLGIQGNGSKDNTEINISGNASVSGKEAAIYHPQGGKLNISGNATLSGATGIIVKGGVVNISGGTISATGAAGEYKPVSSGFQGTGDALYIEHFDNSTDSGNYGTPVVTVTGGTFNSVNGKAVASYANSNNNVEPLSGFISGGTYTDKPDSNYLVAGYSFAKNADGTYGVAVDLKGAGTEANPYQISSLEDLILFRDSVNAGETKYNADGVYVQLTDDIDMAKVDWSVNIGDDCINTFDGIFDGNGHTIKNLNSKETAQKSDGYICTGLFGAIGGNAVVKNFTIKHVTIDTGAYTGNNVAVVVGFALKATGSIENVKVTGDIKINAPGVYGVGIILGYDFYGSLDITGCTVDGSSDSAITGSTGIGGIVGYTSGASTVVSGCKVEDIALNGTGLVGGLVGNLVGATVEKSEVEEVEITITGANWQNSGAIAAGTIAAPSKVAEVTYSDVTVNGNPAEALVGSEYVEHPTTPVGKVQAKIGDVYYAKLQTAIEKAKTGETVKLANSFDLTETVVISKEVTLDLNGYTITGTDNNTSGNFYLINVNKGNLTIDDSSKEKDGAITLVATTERNWNSSSVVVANNQGNVTVNGGTIEHLGGTSMAYGIDNLTNSGIGEAITVVNGGNVDSTYFAIRQFANCTSKMNSVTINGGEVGYVWMQSPNNNANTAETTVTGGSVAGICLTGKNAVYALNAKADAIGEGGIYGEPPVGMEVKEENGVYGLVEIDYVAQIEDVKYRTLAEAIEAVADTAEIQLINDFSLVETVKIPAGKTITLDLNGHTITGTDQNTKDNFYLINVKKDGNLTIKDSIGNGKITLVAMNDRDWGSSSVVVANEQGTLVVESGTIDHLGGTDMAYGIDNLTNGKETEVVTTINGGTIRSTYRAVRQFLNGVDAVNSMTINGGTIEGTNKSIWVQEPNANANPGTLTVGKDANLVGDVYLTANSGATSWPVTVSVDKDALADGYTVVGSNVPAGYAVVEEDGVYVAKKVQAKIGNVYYETLEAAVEEAANGSVIEVLVDIELDATITIPTGKEVTLDLNGYTISQTKECTASYEMINNKGSLTITGNGKISFKDTGAGDPSFGWGSYTVRNEGTLVVENGTIEHLGEQAFGKHMICAIFQYSGSATINGGTISTPNYRSARLWKGDMTINGGTFDGQLWVQAVDNSSDLTINGGSFEPNGGDGSSVFVSNSDYDVKLAVTGGTFETKIGCSDTDKLAGAITGGTFTETAINGTNAQLISTECVVIANADGTYGVVAGLKGAGTEANPYQISSLEELISFRDSVNAGETKYNAEGVYVQLKADIDMSDVDWSVNIGDDCNNTFDGIFDGNGHTIKNLNSKETAQKSDGYICTGLFGAIGGNAVIKNLTIKHVTINTGDFTGNNVAAVVGFAYNATGSIENVKVTGDIEINAKKADGVGAIVGYAYGGRLTIKDCTVNGNDDSVITGQAYNGGIIGYGGGKMTVEGCTVQDVEIVGTSCCTGGIAGILLTGGKAITNTIKNVNVVAEHKNWQNSAAIVVGAVSGTVTVSGTTYADVTAKGEATDVLVGSEHLDKPTTPVGKVQAKIGDVYYTKLQDAVNAAKAGETVTVICDISVVETLEVAAGKEVTLDLNEKTITGEPAEAKAYALIENKGNLTITGEGTILCDHKLAGSTSYAVNTITNCGTLTVESGTIENKSTASNQIGYAIDNNSTSANAVVVISGGKVNVSGSNYYDAIRQFCNSETNDNSVTVNGGTVGSIWMQNPSDGTEKNTKDVKGSVAITDGTVKGLYLEPSTGFEASITGGNIGSVSYFQEAEGRDLTGFISGGTYTEKPDTDYLATGYVLVENADGTYNVEAGEYVAVNVQTETCYDDLTDALAEAKVGETVQMIKATTEDFVRVPANVTLDLNGQTLTAGDFLAYGEVKDNTDGDAKLVISSDAFVQMQSDNEQLPIYDTTTGSYRFFEYELVNMGAKPGTNSVKYGFQIGFANAEAYSVLMNTTKTNMEFIVSLEWDGMKVPAVEYKISDELVQQYAEARVNGKDRMTMTLNVKGLEILDNNSVVKATPIVRTISSVQKVGTPYEYTYTKAVEGE